jgi:hypothetical protein
LALSATSVSTIASLGVFNLLTQYYYHFNFPLIV